MFSALDFVVQSRREPALFIHVFTKRTITFTLVLAIFGGGARARLRVCVCVCVCVCVRCWGVSGGGGGGEREGGGEKGAKESPGFFLKKSPAHNPPSSKIKWSLPNERQTDK